MLNRILEKSTLIVFTKYTISGAFSVVVQMGLLSFSVESLRMSPTLASCYSFILACVVNYVMLYYWTFKSTSSHRIVILRFCVVTLFTLALNLAVFWILTFPLKIWYIISQAIALMVVSLINFAINRRYTFCLLDRNKDVQSSGQDTQIL